MSPVDNLQQRLQAMQGAFNEAPVDAAGQGPMPPDGKYQALVHSFDTFEGKNGAAAGQAFLKTTLQLALSGGEWDGTEVDTIHNLEDPEKIKWVKQHLNVLGLDVENLDLATLLDQLPQLLDVPVEIQIKRSDKKNDAGENYVNVYVNRRLGDPMPKSDVPAPPPPPPAPVGDDDDVPF